MLDTLRANSRSVLTYVLFGIIIVVFVVSFGPGSQGCGAGAGGAGASWAAKVNGDEVSPQDFEQQYAQLARIYASQTAGDTTGLLSLRIRQMAMEQVVERELVEQEAKRQGIAVSDEDVSAAVKAIPAFQREGRFDLDGYKRAVTASYGTPGKFEEQMRRDLAHQRMLTLVRERAKVSEGEVKDAWLAENDKVNLEFARFPVALARAEVKPSEEDVKAFQAKEEARIAKRYEEDKARFDQKKRVRARHILAKVEKGAPDKAWDDAKKRIEDYAARVKKGEDFAKVAAEASDDPGSKERGGDLGQFGEGVMAKEFEAAAFGMKPGELSQPVKTAFGWHLIKVEEVQEPKLVKLDEARPILARELLVDDLAKKLAAERARAALEKLQAGKSFAEVLPPESKDAKKGPPAVKLGGQAVRPDETGIFTAQAVVPPRIGAPVPELVADALRANAGAVLPKVYETPAGPVVVRVKERQRPDEKAFAEKKVEAEVRLRLRRESELERAWVEDLRKKSKVETNAAFVQGTYRAPNVQLD
jgi:peptidyl-prolyl cis-trans isomerase D